METDISKVYFADFHTKPKENLLQKLRRLIISAGIDQIDFQNKFTAIKMHFGEPGNLAYLRPNYARVVAEQVRERGGRPFLTDCNTLYAGRRKNALEHLDAAYENGFSLQAAGCHIIIGDGIKGTDDIAVPVRGTYVQEAKIGRAVMDADILISLTHFKGHEVAGFGGALKNIGMGCGSKAGKMEMHSSGKPRVGRRKCTGCGFCTAHCAYQAITVKDGTAVLDQERCTGCGRCIGMCPFDAIFAAEDEAFSVINKKIAEYCLAVLQNKPAFHISLVTDVSPNCDCRWENDVPIVPDVGMFASFDPVALDLACAEAVNRQPVIEGSLLNRKMRLKKGEANCRDHFINTHPDTDWHVLIEHAAGIGLGNTSYELIKI